MSDEGAHPADQERVARIAQIHVLEESAQPEQGDVPRADRGDGYRVVAQMDRDGVRGEDHVPAALLEVRFRPDGGPHLDGQLVPVVDLVGSAAAAQVGDHDAVALVAAGVGRRAVLAAGLEGVGRVAAVGRRLEADARRVQLVVAAHRLAKHASRPGASRLDLVHSPGEPLRDLLDGAAHHVDAVGRGRRDGGELGLLLPLEHVPGRGVRDDADGAQHHARTEQHQRGDAPGDGQATEHRGRPPARSPGRRARTRSTPRRS